MIEYYTIRTNYFSNHTWMRVTVHKLTTLENLLTFTEIYRIFLKDFPSMSYVGRQVRCVCAAFALFITQLYRKFYIFCLSRKISVENGSKQKPQNLKYGAFNEINKTKIHIYSRQVCLVT